jgi:hypothetical protein
VPASTSYLGCPSELEPTNVYTEKVGKSVYNHNFFYFTLFTKHLTNCQYDYLLKNNHSRSVKKNALPKQADEEKEKRKVVRAD